MENPRKIKNVYINLPISDVKKTRVFWEKLGLGIYEYYSDDQALCLILEENHTYVMLIVKEKFQTFTNRKIADDKTTQVLLAIEVNSKEEVKEMIDLAIKHGGKRYLEPEDHGWMYYDRFIDIDGHQWEVMSMDESKME